MADLYSRSYNPIWDFRSLTGLPLDDTSWAYFLENEIPYFPQNVYQTPSGTPWPSPVQLSAAGTLQDIFFDPSKVYRIEIRTNLGNLTNPTQADPLVWLIENYVPDGGSVNPPVTTASIASSNQITNPQFALVNFSSPLTLTNQSTQTISVAPGWDLVLTGAASDVTLTKLPLNSTDANPTNAPYALEITLTGWTTAYLRQIFSQNGIQWSNKNVTSSITARINGAPQIVTGTLVDSAANLLGSVFSATITADYAEFTGNVLLKDSSNADVPPNASIEYRINLPGSSDISITSIQLLSTNNSVALTYEQETIERQIDHTFNIYKNSILLQPKESILTGWDFPLNPWQFTQKITQNLSGTGGYTADQTILITEQANSITFGPSAVQLDAFEISSRIGVAQGRIALIQYIDSKSCESVWDSVLSSLVQMRLTTSSNTRLKFKMRLIYSTSAPSLINPIASWGTTDPVFTGQYTAIKPLNDPVYSITDSLLTNFSFNQFQMPLQTVPTYLGIVLYTVSPLSSVASDSIIINNISLAKNSVAIETNKLTFDETLRRCQFYFEKTYDTFTQIAAATYPGYVINIIDVRNEGGSARANIPSVSGTYKTVKRSTAPGIEFYAVDGTPNSMDLGIYTINIADDVIIVPIADFTVTTSTNNFLLFSTADSASVSPIYDPRMMGRFGYHFVVDARLGIIP